MVKVKTFSNKYESLVFRSLARFKLLVDTNLYDAKNIAHINDEMPYIYVTNRLSFSLKLSTLCLISILYYMVFKIVNILKKLIKI